MRVVVIGIGNRFRRDDAAGHRTAERVETAALPNVDSIQHDGEPAHLIDLWDGADIAYVVDAVPGDHPGRVHRIDVGDGRVPEQPRRDSSHAVRLGDAVELARALGRLPRRLVLIGIEASDFDAGEGMSPAVDRSADAVAQGIIREIAERA